MIKKCLTTQQPQGLAPFRQPAISLGSELSAGNGWQIVTISISDTGEENGRFSEVRAKVFRSIADETL